ANWCTFATWASRQAGRTIRGEDALGYIEHRLGRDRELLHPLASLGRWLVRKGLFDPSSRLGRVMRRLHTPFDAVALASDAVARGNLKVFEEIGYEFARYGAASSFDEFLASVEPLLLRSAFTRYEAALVEVDPKARAELRLLANLEIGLHEQTRLQPEIGAALDAPYVTAEELGRRLCGTRRPRLAKLAGTLAAPAQGWIAELSREAITHSLMVLSVPGRILALGMHLDDPYPDVLRDLVSTDLEALIAGYEPVPPAPDDCGAHDWSDLHQRMHYIVHLFRAFHLSEQLSWPPFDVDQVASLARGEIPEGEL
ncbi:MAG: hypothetical protein ACJ74C_09670, partial [Gaiellaceae bacterium]